MNIDFNELATKLHTSSEEGDKQILICRNHAGYLLTVYHGIYKLTITIDRSEDIDYVLEKKMKGDYVFVQDGWTSEYLHLIPSYSPAFAREIKELILKLRSLI